MSKELVSHSWLNSTGRLKFGQLIENAEKVVKIARQEWSFELGVKTPGHYDQKLNTVIVTERGLEKIWCEKAVEDLALSLQVALSGLLEWYAGGQQS